MFRDGKGFDKDRSNSNHYTTHPAASPELKESLGSANSLLTVTHVGRTIKRLYRDVCKSPDLAY